MGGLTSLVLYWLFFIILHIWMCLRIARSSSMLAWMTFFFWPTCIFALFRNWGDEESDIRIPFLASVACFALSVWSLYRAGVQFENDQYYVEYSAEDIEEIRREDPQLAAQIEANDGVLDVRTLDDSYVVEYEEETDARPNPDRGTSDLAEMPMAPGEEVSIRSLAIRELETKLSPRSGRIALESAQATLDLPRHFRFLPPAQLRGLASMGVGPVDAHTLGWIVHEQVRLADDDGWFIEVRFEPVGALGVPASSADLQTALGYQDQERPAIEAPAWIPERLTATLLDRETQVGGSVERARALRVTASGVLEFRISGIEAEQRELGLRATRLMAARTTAPAPVAPAEGTEAPAPAYSLHAYAQGKAAPRG